MEKRKWLWKRKSSDRSPGESEGSESMSSPSDRDSDGQEVLKASPSQDNNSPEVMSKGEAHDDVNKIVKTLTEKLSAALVNVSAKEDLVKQHAKVAEEAVAGWEKAENEVTSLKERLDVAIQQKKALDDRVSHLDGALKECVRQLRQAREEQEHEIHESIVKATSEWESTRHELQNQILELQKKVEAAENQPPVHVVPELYKKLEIFERENSFLRFEFQQQSEELEIRTIERDLSTQAAETASKQHLESIKRVAKLEAECRRLRIAATKSPSSNDNKSAAASSIYVESLTDSQSDSGERLNQVEMGNSEQEKGDMGCSDLWGLAVIADHPRFKNEKSICKTSVQIDLMDDFLEMERLAALPEASRRESESCLKEANENGSSLRKELDAAICHTMELEEKLVKLEKEKADLQMALAESQLSISATELQLRAELDAVLNRMTELQEKLEQIEKEKNELQTALLVSGHSNEESELKLRAELDAVLNHTTELEGKLEQIEKEKNELQTALIVSGHSLEQSELKLREALTMLEELQKELNSATEAKRVLDSQLDHLEVEARTSNAQVDLLKEEVKKEKALSTELSIKCQELEEELARKEEDLHSHEIANSISQPKIKQEDLDLAAGRLVECQKTIVSLRKQLESLATLEDFLIDTANIPEFTAGGSIVPRANGELWRLHSNGTYSPKRDPDSLNIAVLKSCPSVNQNDLGKSPASLSSSNSSTSQSAQISSEKNRNGFAKFFSRTKNGIQLEI